VSRYESETSIISDNNDDDHHDHDQGQDKDKDRVPYKLELVLRKWFAIDPSREMRAFVREGVLIGAFVSFSHFRFFRRPVPFSNKHNCKFVCECLIFHHLVSQVYRSVIRTITSF
jgi:hypothetical protein